MVARSDVTRAAYLAARLEEVERALAFVAAGGGVATIEIRNPQSETDTVHVMAETPLVVEGLEAGLAGLRGQLLGDLAAIGVDCA